jgi:hypothetical protein
MIMSTLITPWPADAEAGSFATRPNRKYARSSQVLAGSTAVLAVTPTTRAGNTSSFCRIDRPAAIADDTAWLSASSPGTSDRRSGHRAMKARHASRASSWCVVPANVGRAPARHCRHKTEQSRGALGLACWSTPYACCSSSRKWPGLRADRGLAWPQFSMRTRREQAHLCLSLSIPIRVCILDKYWTKRSGQ